MATRLKGMETGGPRFDLEIREDFLGDRGKEQWVIERHNGSATEHGPFRSWKEAKELIERRKRELASN